MVQSSKRKKPKLPKDIESRLDFEVAEMIFGKRIKKELDRVAETVDSKRIPDLMKT